MAKILKSLGKVLTGKPVPTKCLGFYHLQLIFIS
jgi:hypothetical protein